MIKKLMANIGTFLSECVCRPFQATQVLFTWILLTIIYCLLAIALLAAIVFFGAFFPIKTLVAGKGS